MNKLKHHFPPNILEMIYNSLILSRLHYGILLWGYNHKRIGILQEKAIRIITLDKYLAHSEPPFKRLNKLTIIEDLFILNQLIFCYNIINNKLPDYFENTNLVKCRDTHRQDTRIKIDCILGKYPMHLQKNAFVFLYHIFWRTQIHISLIQSIPIALLVLLIIIKKNIPFY